MLNNNGSALTPRRCQEALDSGLTRMRFSLDAFTPETYSKVRVGSLPLEKVIRNIDTQKTDGKNAVLLTLFSIAYGTIIGSIGTPSGGARNVIMINYLQEFSNVSIDYWKWMKHAYPILMIQLIVAYFVLQFTFPSSLNNIKMRGFKKNVGKTDVKKNINHLFSKKSKKTQQRKSMTKIY